jgi:hypothetical protein
MDRVSSTYWVLYNNLRTLTSDSASG